VHLQERSCIFFSLSPLSVFVPSKKISVLFFFFSFRLAMAGETRIVELKGEGKTVTIESKGWGAADGPDPSIVELLQSGHGPAGATGLTHWEGGHVAAEAILQGATVDVEGQRMIELGSGTGIAGLAAAARGADVLLTDLAPVVEASTEHNIERNSKGPCEASAFKGSRRVGSGSAATAELDWKEAAKGSIPSDRYEELLKADILMAAEAVWLRELVPCFVSTCLWLMRECLNLPPLLLWTRDRSSGRESSSFVPVDTAIAELADSAHVELVASHGDVHLFRASLRH